MSSGIHRILVIDDNQGIHDDLKKILLQDTQTETTFRTAEDILFGEDSETVHFNSKFSIDSAFQGAEGLEMVKNSLEEKQPYALAFVDVRMPPGWDGLETVTRIWQLYPELQVVICTAYSDYSWRDMMNILGSSENLMVLKKPFDSIEALQLAHGLTKKWSLARQLNDQLRDLDDLVHERTQDLLDSEERFSNAFKNSPIAMAIQALGPEHLIDVNPTFVKLTGYNLEESPGMSLADLNLWVESEAREKITFSVRQNEAFKEFRCQLRTREGILREVSLFGEVFNLGDKPHHLLLIEDVTDRINLEEQLRQTHKMEALGQVAAGVAHDFNNILTIIQGNVSHVLDRKTFESEVENGLRQVLSASDRASLLVRQLLAFTRKQVVQLKPIKLGSFVQRYAHILHRLIGEQISLETYINLDLPLIMADACSLEQVLMNLAVNARDAMPEGGKLIIEMDETRINEPPHQESGQSIEAGQFIRLRVIDTGVGIEESVMEHLFEPFFTTKDVGKGTGMGLATAYGVIRQHEGWIEISSQVGKGSTFTIYFPVCSCEAEEPVVSKPVTENAQLTRNGSETVMVVEDEPFLREFVHNVLKQNGYTILLASDAGEALRKWDNCKGEIDLLLTDIVMPGGMSGRQLVEQLSQRNPGLKAIYTSGYTTEILGTDFDENSDRAFLQKPYRSEELIRTIRASLDR